MRKLYFFILAFALLSCAKKDEMMTFGEKITAEGAQPVASVVKLMEGKDSVQAKLSGKVAECCQNKGCWMTLDIGQGEPMRVSFKDYGFFVPKNSAGKTAVIDGWAYRTVTPVEDLRHYAEDEGKSPEEIEKITEPLEEITFVANGVLLEPDKQEKSN